MTTGRNRENYDYSQEEQYRKYREKYFGSDDDDMYRSRSKSEPEPEEEEYEEDDSEPIEREYSQKRKKTKNPFVWIWHWIYDTFGFELFNKKKDKELNDEEYYEEYEEEEEKPKKRTGFSYRDSKRDDYEEDTKREERETEKRYRSKSESMQENVITLNDKSIKMMAFLPRTFDDLERVHEAVMNGKIVWVNINYAENVKEYNAILYYIKGVSDTLKYKVAFPYENILCIVPRYLDFKMDEGLNQFNYEQYYSDKK